MAENLTTKAASDKGGKPAKPHPDFPLYSHASGRWAKKVLGKTHFFGPWSDPDGALQRWLDQKDDLLAGRAPRPKSDGLPLHELVNRFLTAKRQKVDAGEMQERSWYDLKRTATEVTAYFGRNRVVVDLRPEDFGSLRARWAKRLGPVGLWNQIRRARMIFSWGHKNGLLAAPMLYGDMFNPPPKRILRLDRASKPAKMFEAEEVRKILAAASRQMRAAVYLAINAAMGAADLSELPITAIDLDAGMLSWRRGKTGIERSCPLWPETIAAVREVLEHRKEPKDPACAPLLFVNKFGKPYVRGVGTDGFGQEFRKLCNALGIEREGVSLYSLRHVFRTVADETGDVRAIDIIMGHVNASVADFYLHGIGEARLRKVTDHVRTWLEPGKAAAVGSQEAQA